MIASEWDIVETFLAEKLLTEELTASDAVVRTCKSYRLVSVHYLALSLASAASALKSEWALGTHNDDTRLIDLHEVIIGLTVDLAVLELSGRRAHTCADLLEHWKAERDPLFLVT